MISLTPVSALAYYLCFTMIKFIFYGLVVYLLYKLVFELVIPVSKVSAQMKEKLQQMQDQQKYQQQQSSPGAEPVTASKANTDKDYIDFEEIKP